jgi:hypothetical protein
MSASQPSVLQQDFDLSYWAYSQAGTSYVDGPTQLPDGFSYLISGGAPVIDYDPATGFYGAALVGSTGQVVIAFEGTNLYTGNNVFTTGQSLDDAAISAGVSAPSYSTAYDFTEAAIKDAETTGVGAAAISLTGHSLGGADAEAVAQMTGLPGITFGAPGIAMAAAASTASNFYDYVDEGDPVGNYAAGGNEDALLLADNIAHYGQAAFVGPYTNAALLLAASVAYVAAENSTSPTYAAAEYAASTAAVALATSYYHPLTNYALDLSLTVPGASGGLAGSPDPSAGGTGQIGLLDIPGLDLTGAGALQVTVTETGTGTGTGITLTSDGQSYSFALPASHKTFSLSSDGQGGTLVTPGATTSGTVFAGANGATVQGGSGPLYFVGGTGAVSVTGGSGNTTLFGSTASNSVLRGGSGSNVITAGAGSSTLIGGTGASTLIGGAGRTEEFASGAGPVELIGGAGANTIYGTTGSGAETVVTGSGVTFASLDNAAASVVGGSGASSVVGGSGPDVFGFINGHAGGSMVIAGLTASDSIAFGGYSGDAITSEGVLAGSDLITLSDGTVILLQGIDHTVFKGLV